ncbi:hypothetical protein ONJ23_25980, partial [Salmonella enterica subsp. enterica serovar Virginia]|nr:hypothetical protein [Salmonella enterica subsp. enterica serovar Virginia]
KYRYDRYQLIRNRQMADIMFDWVTQNLMNGRGVNRLDNTQRPLGNANLIGREELQHARDAVASAQAQLDVAIQQYNANQAMILN